jgi:GNAT superfamily N-acetyltransferase
VLHWVAEEDGRVLGELLCHFLRLPSEAGSEGRRGVGKALVQEMLGWMKDAGVPEVWVLADNPAAEAFYATCGFTRGAENEQGVLMLRSV